MILYDVMKLTHHLWKRGDEVTPESLLGIYSLQRDSFSWQMSVCKISKSLKSLKVARFTLKFDELLSSSAAAESPVKFQSDWVTAKTVRLLPDWGWIWLNFADFKHEYKKEVYWSDVCVCWLQSVNRFVVTGDWKNLNLNLATLRFSDFWRWNVW